MKTYFIPLSVLLFSATAAAQPDYPEAPAPAGNIVQAEYFFDTDPGFGNGKLIAITPAVNINALSFQADLTGLSNGFHRLYIRTKDATGHWSFTNNDLFDNFILPAYSVAPPAPRNMVAAEYYVDADPGYGNGIPLTLPPAQDLNNANIAINVTGLPPGTHRLYIRTRDADGRWSLINMSVFDNSLTVPYPTTPIPAPPIGEMEYYFDTDPGFGNGTAINFTPGIDITNLSVNISLNSLSPGEHTLFIRSRQNPWSLSAYADFMYGSSLPVNWLYVQGAIRDNKAAIDWATVQESNTHSFIIEHSVNGSEFTDAGTLPAKGNSEVTQRYQFLHHGLQPGMNYYRIRQTDKDGKYTWSKTVTLFYRHGQQTTIIAPNPVHDVLHIVEAGQGPEKIELFDLGGRLVLSQGKAPVQPVYSINVSALKPGQYIVKIYYRHGQQVHAIIKQ